MANTGLQLYRLQPIGRVRLGGVAQASLPWKAESALGHVVPPRGRGRVVQQTRTRGQGMPKSASRMQKLGMHGRHVPTQEATNTQDSRLDTHARRAT
jgi:hypothetical protein